MSTDKIDPTKKEAATVSGELTEEQLQLRFGWRRQDYEQDCKQAAG